MKRMDKITHEVCMAQWKAIIEECLSRLKGQSAKQWLAEKGRKHMLLIKKDTALPAMPVPRQFMRIFIAFAPFRSGYFAP